MVIIPWSFLAMSPAQTLRESARQVSEVKLVESLYDPPVHPGLHGFGVDSLPNHALIALLPTLDLPDSSCIFRKDRVFLPSSRSHALGAAYSIPLLYAPDHRNVQVAERGRASKTSLNLRFVLLICWRASENIGARREAWQIANELVLNKRIPRSSRTKPC